MPTRILPGSDQAIRKQSVLLMHEFITGSWIETWLGGQGTVKQGVPNPVRFVDDLNGKKGESLTIDFLQTPGGYGVTGDTSLSGKGKPIVFSSQTISVDQYRDAIDLGGRMDRQRTVHDLMALGRPELSKMLARWKDQIASCYLAGNAPTAANANFDIVPTTFTGFADNDLIDFYDSDWAGDVILPPTYATSFDSADVLSVAYLEAICQALADEATPPTPLFEEAGEPMWMFLVDTKAFRQLTNGATAGDYTQLKKYSQSNEDKVWKITKAVWKNLLIVPYARVVRYDDPTAGTAKISANSVLGADALAMLRCVDPDTGNPMILTEEIEDHGNKRELGAGLICGMQRIVKDGVSHSVRHCPTYYSE